MNKKMFLDKLKSCKELLQIQNTAMTNILEKRLVFNRLNEIIKANKDLQVYNLFWDWYFYNYIDAQVMEIMRILDKDDGSKNMFRLLESLENGFKIDKDFFKNVREDIKEHAQTPEIVYYAVPLLNSKIIKQDVAELEKEMNSVKKYRDWKVAHNENQKQKDLDLNLEKLNKIIDILHKKILSYELHINGNGYDEKTGLLPTITYDWEKIFRVAWINKK